MNLAMGLMGGLVLGVGLVVLLEKRDARLRVQEDVEDQLGAPFLGLFPVIPSNVAETQRARDLFASQSPDSSVAECCQSSAPTSSSPTDPEPRAPW